MYNSLGKKCCRCWVKVYTPAICKKKLCKQFHYSFKKSERERDPLKICILKQVSSGSAMSDPVEGDATKFGDTGNIGSFGSGKE